MTTFFVAGSNVNSVMFPIGSTYGMPHYMSAHRAVNPFTFTSS
jgi:hypothetical protein